MNEQPIKHIGFTGTRHGMTNEQRRHVDMLIAEVIGGDVHLRVVANHGDCVGADAKFHELARRYGCKVVGHPSTHSLRAYCQFDHEYERRSPMVRNANIVSDSDVMIATPQEAQEQVRGGTWGTIRIARRAKKPLAIVYPDGTVERERWP